MKVKNAAPTGVVPVDKPIDIWRALRTSAGLELRRGASPGRDAEFETALIHELRSRFPDIPAARYRTLRSLLDTDARSSRSQITTETFLATLFESQRGFAAMMRGILELLADAKAPHSDAQLPIRLALGDNKDALQLLFNEFREQVEKLERVLRSRFEVGSSGLLKDVHGTVMRLVEDQGTKASLVSQVETRSKAGFDLPPHPPATGNQPFDEMLEVLYGYVAALRSWAEQIAGTRDLLLGRARESFARRPNGSEDLLRAELISNYLDSDLVYGIHALAQSALFAPAEIPKLVARLSNIVGVIPRRQAWIERAVTELSEVLRLPVWKHRYELYSVWVGAILLRTAGKRAASFRFVPTDGVLCFAFKGSRLAVFEHGDQSYEIASEMRTDLVGTSKKRKKGIQPDFRVCMLPESADRNVDTRLIVECKHYLVADPVNFTAAANDYARSCPTATVLVVNHGEGKNELLVGAVEASHARRVTFLHRSSVDTDGGAELASTIEQALFPVTTRTTVREGATESSFRLVNADVAASIGVVWGASLRDLDLSLRFGDHDVNFRSVGELNHEPYAKLSADVRAGPGEEVIEISRWIAASYEIRVTNFSREGVLERSNVHCDVVLDTGVHRLRPALPRTDDWVVGHLEIQQKRAKLVPSSHSHLTTPSDDV
jgi:hypothetical protein